LLRDPWFRFAAAFAALAVGCEVLYYSVLVGSPWMGGYLRALALAAAAVLELLGTETQVRLSVLTTERFAVEIAHGCDAIQICALYSSAVLAFPAAWRRKLWGLGLGVLWLQILNQARIVSLVLIGPAYPEHFETVHFDVWPSALIVVTVASWIAWARWATRDVAKPEPTAGA
jgi:exosortase/archaeosortase family protein